MSGQINFDTLVDSMGALNRLANYRIGPTVDVAVCSTELDGDPAQAYANAS